MRVGNRAVSIGSILVGAAALLKILKEHRKAPPRAALQGSKNVHA